MEKGQDRTSASNAVVTSRMLDESKCGVFQKSRRCWRTMR
jgi:hypothetical protein